MSQESIPDQSHKGYLFAGFASLLIAAFIDNARGPVLPVLCEQLQIPYETAGLFLMIGSLAAVISTYIMGQLLPKVGERRTAIGVCWIAILPGILAPFVDGRSRLLLLGLLLGVSISLVGTLSSILTVRGSSFKARGRLLSMQHVMYGIGSFAGPLLFSFLTYVHLPWWWLFAGASFVCFILGLLYIWILPIADLETVLHSKAAESAKMDLKSLQMIFIFAFYVAGEVLASMWMSSLLVGKHGLLPETAARYQMGFFLLMGLTRFLCFICVKPRWEKLVLITCLLFGSIFAMLGQQGFSWALPLIGVVGPFFPLTMARVSIQYPATWKAKMIYIYLGIQTVLAIMHLTVGNIADQLGIEQAFLITPVLLILTLALLIPTLNKSAA